MRSTTKNCTDESTKDGPVGVVTTIMGKANEAPLQNLLRILGELRGVSVVVKTQPSDPLHVHSMIAQDVNTIFIEHHSRKGFVQSTLALIGTQMRIALAVVLNIRRSREWVFYLGDTMIVPVLMVRLLGSRAIVLLGGSLEREIEFKYGRLGRVLPILKSATLTLSNTILLYSQDLINIWSLSRYSEKIKVANEHFIDLNEFCITKRLDQRTKTVGYIGRFSPEKGVLNLMEAFVNISRERNDFRFLIVGDGPLIREVLDKIQSGNLSGNARATGWIPHNEIPATLSQIKLLVLPSLSEGLPNVILEAMACGTPVLATGVGVVREIIIDGKTGYILEDTEPIRIAMKITSCLDDENLEEVVRNARRLVEEKYSFPATLDKWRKVLGGIEVPHDAKPR